MPAQNKSAQREGPGDKAKEVGGKEADAAGSVVEAVREKLPTKKEAGRALREAKDAVGSAARKVAEGAGGLVEVIKDKLPGQDSPKPARKRSTTAGKSGTASASSAKSTKSATSSKSTGSTGKTKTSTASKSSDKS